MEQRQTRLLHSVLSIEKDYHPETHIDITFLDVFMERWPLSGVVDLGQADAIASESVHVQSTLADHLSKIIKFQKEMEDKGEGAYAVAYACSSAKDVTGKKQDAVRDPVYLDIIGKEASAKGAKKFLEEKLKIVSQMHYYCKGLMERQQVIQPQEGDYRGGRDEVPVVEEYPE